MEPLCVGRAIIDLKEPNDIPTSIGGNLAAKMVAVHLPKLIV